MCINSGEDPIAGSRQGSSISSGTRHREVSAIQLLSQTSITAIQLEMGSLYSLFLRCPLRFFINEFHSFSLCCSFLQSRKRTTAKKLFLQILSERLIRTASACSAEEAARAAGRKDAAVWSRQGARLPMSVFRQWTLLLLSPQVLLMKNNPATLTKNNFPTAGKDQPVLLLDCCLV